MELLYSTLIKKFGRRSCIGQRSSHAASNFRLNISIAIVPRLSKLKMEKTVKVENLAGRGILGL